MYARDHQKEYSAKLKELLRRNQEVTVERPDNGESIKVHVYQEIIFEYQLICTFQNIPIYSYYQVVTVPHSKMLLVTYAEGRTIKYIGYSKA